MDVKKEGKVFHIILLNHAHSLCLGKGELLLAQIQACERLLKYTKDDEEITALKVEIAKLKLVLDLIRY